MGALSTVKNYLKQIEALEVNPVCISDRQKKAMAQIEQKHPMPEFKGYKYGEDFIFNPLVNLNVIYQITEKNKYEI